MQKFYAKIRAMAVKRISSFRVSLSESVWPVKKRRQPDANTSWSRVLNDLVGIAGNARYSVTV